MNHTKLFAIFLLFALVSHSVKSDEEIKGTGKNEPTWDNPPDWVPGEFNENDEVVTNNMNPNDLKTTKKEEKKSENKKEEEVEVKEADKTTPTEALKEGEDPAMKEKIEKEKKKIEDLSEQLKNIDKMDKDEVKQKFADEEKAFAAKTKKDMGLDTMEVISKDLFREYLTRIMYSESDVEEDEDDVDVPEKDVEVIEEPRTKEEIEEDEFMSMITEEIMKEIPDSMNQEEFSKYADTEKYQPIIDNALKKKFGNNYHEDIVGMMKNGLSGEMGEGMAGMSGGMPHTGDMKSPMDGEQEDLDDDEDGDEDDDDEDEDEEQVTVEDTVETTDEEDAVEITDEEVNESSTNGENFADDMPFNEGDSGEQIYEKMMAEMEKNPKEMEEMKNLIADKLKNIKVETKDGKDVFSEKDKEDL